MTNQKSKIKNYLIISCLSLIFYGCITDYEATGIDEIAGILVVEGLITEGESYFTLSRSNYLTDNDWGWTSSSYIYNARVFVDRDDGEVFPAEPVDYYTFPPRYLVKTGELYPDRRYRLRVEIDEYDHGDIGHGWMLPDSDVNIYEYLSEYTRPVITPEIDSVFWTKRDRGQPIFIHVATKAPDDDVMFFRWSFKEDWEVHSEYYIEEYPYYCWNRASSNDFYMGSTQRTAFGMMIERLVEIPPSHFKLSQLYRVNITQNAISHRAYIYFENIKKNNTQTGSIFAPIPSELRGNIVCTTDPARPVIGFIDVSTTRSELLYISRNDGLFEPFVRFDCVETPSDSLLVWYNYIPPWYVQIPQLEVGMPPMYIHNICVDCTFYGDQQSPDDWPNVYY